MAGDYLTIKLHHFAIKYVWIYLLLVVASEVSCLKCFNCGTESHYKQTCDNFNSNSDSFIEDCRDDHLGCSTVITKGVVQSRNCDQYRVDDCKALGDTTYCFCTSHLCNGATYLTTTKLPSEPSDDEDMEGSGTTNHVITEKPEIPCVRSETSSASKLGGTIIFLAVLLHF